MAKFTNQKHMQCLRAKFARFESVQYARVMYEFVSLGKRDGSTNCKTL